MPESDIPERIDRVLGAISVYGDLEGWWPGHGDEVVIGAILTQQTRWENVEQALTRLKEKGLCDLRRVYQAPDGEIEEAIRPSGFYRVKTRRLKALAQHIIERHGSLEAMSVCPFPLLRTELLNVPGIGPETADSILCYGLGKPTLVVDRYTERICECAGMKERGEQLKMYLERHLSAEVPLLRTVHARFVEHAKQCCGKKRCSECGIARPNG